jgi:hypothetical protein
MNRKPRLLRRAVGEARARAYSNLPDNLVFARIRFDTDLVAWDTRAGEGQLKVKEEKREK